MLRAALFLAAALMLAVPGLAAAKPLWCQATTVRCLNKSNTCKETLPQGVGIEDDELERTRWFAVKDSYLYAKGEIIGPVDKVYDFKDKAVWQWIATGSGSVTTLLVNRKTGEFIYLAAVHPAFSLDRRLNENDFNPTPTAFIIHGRCTRGPRG